MGIIQPAARPSYPSPKTVVILASSNGAGVGASTYVGDPSTTVGYGRPGGYGSPSTSWVGLLSTALKAIDPAWDIINVSISGTGVNDSIARFWTDVAPFRPAFVFLGTAPSNDGVNAQLILAGTEQLIRMCRSIGAVPIVRGAYCYNSYTATQYQRMRALNQQLDLLGAHRIDHFSTLEDGTGRFVGGTTFQIGDGLHNTDAGHEVLFRAVDLGIFLRGADNPRREGRPGAWMFGTTANSTGQGIIVTPATNLPGAGLKSWTMRARLKSQSGVANARLLIGAWVFGPGQFATRVRTPTGPVEIVDNNGVTGAVGAAGAWNPGTDFTPHEIVMSYNEATQKVSLYDQGVLLGSMTVTGYAPCQYFGFGGNLNAGAGSFCGGFAVSALSLWAVALQPADIADMVRTGRKPPGSMVIDAVMDAAPAPASYVPNAINNGAFPLIGSDVPYASAAVF